MRTGDFERGVPADELGRLEKTLRRLGTDVLFMPGSQSRTTIEIDDLKLLMRAARDATHASKMYDALVPAYDELAEIGRLDEVAPELDSVLGNYEAFHRESE